MLSDPPDSASLSLSSSPSDFTGSLATGTGLSFDFPSFSLALFLNTRTIKYTEPHTSIKETYLRNDWRTSSMSFPSSSTDETELPGLLITLSSSSLPTPLAEDEEEDEEEEEDRDELEDRAPLQNFDILFGLRAGLVGLVEDLVGLTGWMRAG